jgi:hypothetical protein
MPRREHLANAAIKLGAAHCFQDKRRGRRRSPTAKQPGFNAAGFPGLQSGHISRNTH